MTRNTAASSACIAAIVALIVIVCWPGVHGFWGRDDFMQLAFARMLGSPWALFVEDHYFPVPGSIFRPLGFASMWLDTALFGTDYPAHAMVDFALHAAVALTLFGVLRSVAVSRPIGLGCTLLFGLHPAVVGTASWWSARFDLLATLFVLLGVRLAFGYRERGHASFLLAALLAALAAMLSKEVGLVVLLPLSWLWLSWAWQTPESRSKAMTAMAATWICAIAYFAWRHAVLGTATSGLTGDMPLVAAIGKGLLDWLQQAPGYLMFWARLDPMQRIALATALLALLGMIIVAAMSTRAASERGRSIDLAVCGLCLLFGPALLQAPIAAFNAAPLSASVSAIEAAMQSRLYYLTMAGFAMFLAALLMPCWNRRAAGMRAALIAALCVGVLALATASRREAASFATRSMEISASARAAVSAINALELPRADCHVAFLDVVPPPEWSIYVSMDSVIKALSPELDRVEHCYFHANYPTYFHLLAAPADPSDAAPYHPLQVDGHTVPWRVIGDVVVAYLAAPADVRASEFPEMLFLQYRDGAFRDISAGVRDGREPATLK